MSTSRHDEWCERVRRLTNNMNSSPKRAFPWDLHIEASGFIELQRPEKMTEVVVAEVEELVNRVYKIFYYYLDENGERKMKWTRFDCEDPHIHPYGWHKDKKVLENGEMVPMRAYSGYLTRRRKIFVPEIPLKGLKKHNLQPGDVLVLANEKFNEFKYAHVSPDQCLVDSHLWFRLRSGLQEVAEKNGEPSYFHITDPRIMTVQFANENGIRISLPPDVQEIKGLPNRIRYQEFASEAVNLGHVEFVECCGLERVALEPDWIGTTAYDRNLKHIQILSLGSSLDSMAAVVHTQHEHLFEIFCAREQTPRFYHYLHPALAEYEFSFTNNHFTAPDDDLFYDLALMRIVERELPGEIEYIPNLDDAADEDIVEEVNMDVVEIGM